MSATQMVNSNDFRHSHTDSFTYSYQQLLIVSVTPTGAQAENHITMVSLLSGDV